jgi:hypothetical protein
MMKTLPEILRIDKSKIVDYLLHSRNSQGKAEFFFRYGFQSEDWSVLANALLAQAKSNPIAQTVDSEWGSRYSVDGPLQTPSAKQPNPMVRTIGQRDHGQDGCRLITAHPLRSKDAE